MYIFGNFLDCCNWIYCVVVSLRRCRVQGANSELQNTPQNVTLDASHSSPLEGRPLWRIQRHPDASGRGVLEFHIDPYTHPNTQRYILRGVL